MIYILKKLQGFEKSFRPGQKSSTLEYLYEKNLLAAPGTKVFSTSVRLETLELTRLPFCVCVVQAIFSISTDFTRVAKSGWK